MDGDRYASSYISSRWLHMLWVVLALVLVVAGIVATVVRLGGVRNTMALVASKLIPRVSFKSLLSRLVWYKQCN